MSLTPLQIDILAWLGIGIVLILAGIGLYCLLG